MKATINAAVKASVSNRLKVYAVEKNPMRCTPYAIEHKVKTGPPSTQKFFMATVECGKRLKSATFLFLNC